MSWGIAAWLVADWVDSEPLVAFLYPQAPACGDDGVSGASLRICPIPQHVGIAFKLFLVYFAQASCGDHCDRGLALVR